MKTILLAVSGGKDSITMADMCRRHIHFAADEGGIFDGASFAVAHCNFHLRGEESDADASFVEAWAVESGFRFHRADFDTESYASEKGLSIEMAARELRYAWFASLCEDFSYDGVAVAHNANDNAETLILNLVRGSGLKGICGMSFKSKLPLPDKNVILYRPLLDMARSQIDSYVSIRGLQYRTDRTNADCRYKRNLVRNKLFPLLEQLNPSFLDTLNADMRIFSQSEKVLDEWVEENMPKVLVSKETCDSISIKALMSLDNWRYLLFRIMSDHGFNQAAFSSLEAMLLAEGGTFAGKVLDGRHCRLETSRDRIDMFFTPEKDEISSILIESDGEYCFNGVHFTVETRDSKPGQSLKCSEGTLVCDASKISFPLLCRRWRQGDWFVPFGMKGKKKLSDFFTDKHSTREEKRKALILTRRDDTDGRVLAVLGKRMDDSLRADKDSSRLVYFIVTS